ncbi:Adenylosuccinate lyase [Candidatus Kinetoplastibacterium sorsogonicusi]|uniref:Adenylosuccinate lyase n=1 Tax=Candidatus Kinetoplastidibacterium kentomonadis TaxID=1576550 RepID=A0A3S7J9V9_9PROT|nr:adenylosuccinate lyase [Candidatus Kinetoplastibacterium sorsogonicusi]AWD32462.1 Adenylosuccinate lyase [Candidatus Kinetoplastibacterium sorsogonicusi]
MDNINSLSPLDGRYFNISKELRNFFSETAFIKHRIEVEVKWFKSLFDANLPGLPILSKKAKSFLDDIILNISTDDFLNIKNIEKVTNHDVKAIEYWLKNKIKENHELVKFQEFVHFACTSEDINNTAYALMLFRSRESIILPTLTKIYTILSDMSCKYADQPMLSRTHGQPASPTTTGKELKNFSVRLYKEIETIKDIKIFAKMNGATGNYNAHVITYSEIDWNEFSKNFINSLGLLQNTHTTQIEPHDWISNLFDSITRANNILLDLNKDIWGYISLGYFKQIIKDGEIGSSTMPHKVNPIDFENSEGNLGLSNAIMRHMSDKLTQSRWQRDLSDSTVLRNLGVAIGYSLIAWKSCLRGLNKLELNKVRIDEDIDNCWEILAEPIQTIMRRYNIENPYEKLKYLTRGKIINKEMIHDFIKNLNLPKETIDLLLKLTPRSYIGLAHTLAKH